MLTIEEFADSNDLSIDQVMDGVRSGKYQSDYKEGKLLIGPSAGTNALFAENIRYLVLGRDPTRPKWNGILSAVLMVYLWVAFLMTYIMLTDQILK